MICRRFSMGEKTNCSVDMMSPSNIQPPLDLSSPKSQSLPTLCHIPPCFDATLSEVRESNLLVYQSNQSEQPRTKTESCLHSSDEIMGTFCQTSECLIEMEIMVLPMVSDLSRKELRIPASTITAEKRNVLKKIAAANDLVVLNIGKGKSAVIVLRKKATLLQRQAVEREALIKAAQEPRIALVDHESKVCKDDLVPQTAESAQKRMSISIQASESEAISSKKELSIMTTTSISNGLSETSAMNSAARRKARREAIAKAAAATALAKSRMVESTMQTCPPDYLLCPWCTKEIPPDAQCGHVDICRAGLKQQARQAKVEAQLAQHRLTMENSRRRKLGLAPLKQTAFKCKKNPMPPSSSRSNREISRSPSQRSRSRTHSVDSKQSAAYKRLAVVAAQLESVHPNDVDGMLHASQRICAYVDCAHLVGASGGACSYCRMALCAQHRLPHTGHECKSAPLPKKRDKSCEENQKKMDMACGEDCEERQLALRSRLKERLRNLADKRQR